MCSLCSGPHSMWEQPACELQTLLFLPNLTACRYFNLPQLAPSYKICPNTFYTKLYGDDTYHHLEFLFQPLQKLIIFSQLQVSKTHTNYSQLLPSRFILRREELKQFNFQFRALKYMKYKVVQIWPGWFVCKQVTVCPGHIWTTL
jgi:hypothetical protein